MLASCQRSTEGCAVAGKPVCDYDAAVRKKLVDVLAKDATAALVVLGGRELGPALTQTGGLLPTVLGQDLDTGTGGVFNIARRGRQGPGHLYRGHLGPPWA